MDRQEQLRSLRRHVRAAVEARFSSAPLAERARIVAFADGYMQALLDRGLVDRVELLDLLAEERERVAPRTGLVPLTPEAA